MSIPQDLLKKRILIEDQFATVRYVGPVPPRGEWIGVEWDNASRGKHDGVHDQVRYFTCSVPNSGSFIRFSPKIDTGRSFVSAIVERYIEDPYQKINNEGEAYDAQKDLDTIYWAGNTKIEVEALGWEKVRRKLRQLDRLHEVGLSFERVSSAGNPGEIEALCPNIIDLNLSKNLLPDWETVISICKQLKKLEILRLNYNRFQVLTSTPNASDAFLNLKNLSLNYTRITWDQIELLEPCLPNIENLQLGFNDIKLRTVDDGDKENQTIKKISGFAKLKIINLESNDIRTWDEVARFSDLPRSKAYQFEGFPKLRYINMNENKIDNWKSVDELNKFPSLQELRIKKNPFLEGEKLDETSLSIVGRIKRLKMLNGSTISPENRTDAERFYLKLCIKDTKKTPEEIAEQHPRFKELCEIHGTPVADEISVIATSNILKDRLLALTITYRPSLEGEPIKKVSKKLLGTMEIRNLKNLLQKLFGIPASRQNLYGISNRQHGSDNKEMSKVEINDDLRQLSYYDVSSGDEIIILSS
ncbi:10838_t:CDS:10 [Acaulospora morrowiae]|uniref:10838_t:CDS:1 n=1 Tax=Acaulospora morrowiae TaxID=94023 RepID=A0A9N8WB88_9GLOM|nr:10838_t:CDS:10 [Acaulospora morrowiae]